MAHKKMRQSNIRRQKPSFDPHSKLNHLIRRPSVSSRVNPSINSVIRETAKKFGVTRSFVIHVALADYFGFAVERYSTERSRQ